VKAHVYDLYYIDFLFLLKKNGLTCNFTKRLKGDGQKNTKVVEEWGVVGLNSGMH